MSLIVLISGVMESTRNTLHAAKDSLCSYVSGGFVWVVLAVSELANR